MYDMPAELLRPGTRFVDIIGHRKTIGALPGEPDEFSQKFMSTMTAGELLKLLVEMKDGRVISVLRPADGGRRLDFDP